MRGLFTYCITIQKLNYKDDLKRIANISDYLRNINCKYFRDYKSNSDSKFHYYYFINEDHAKQFKLVYGQKT